MPYYSLYGLSILSQSELRGLCPVAREDKPDVTIRSDDYFSPFEPEGTFYRTRFTSRYTDPRNGLPQIVVLEDLASRTLILEYSEGIQFRISADGRSVTFAYKLGVSLDEVVAYLLGSVFGLLLRQQGVVCLHASAVVVEGEAVAFVGPSGRGKSTIAALMAQKGLVILTDDVLALGVTEASSIVGYPGYPRLKIWPGVADEINAPDTARSPIVANHPDWLKLYLHLANEEYRFADGPEPLGVIYALETDERLPSGAFEVQEIAQSEAMLHLLANTFANSVIDRQLRAGEFGLLGKVVSTVPVRRLVLPRDASSIGASLNRLFADIVYTSRLRK